MHGDQYRSCNVQKGSRKVAWAQLQCNMQTDDNQNISLWRVKLCGYVLFSVVVRVSFSLFIQNINSTLRTIIKVLYARQYKRRNISK